MCRDALVHIMAQWRDSSALETHARIHNYCQIMIADDCPSISLDLRFPLFKKGVFSPRQR